MSESPRKDVDRRAMSALSAGHLFTDLNQGAVAALLPFLVAERGLSLAAAGRPPEIPPRRRGRLWAR